MSSRATKTNQSRTKNSNFVRENFRCGKGRRWNYNHHIHGWKYICNKYTERRVSNMKSYQQKRKATRKNLSRLCNSEIHNDKQVTHKRCGYYCECLDSRIEFTTQSLDRAVDFLYPNPYL